MLELHNLDIHYGAIQALRRVSLQVEPGKIVALLGSNGAGKSTTLRAISGLLRPSSGKILFEGQSIAGRPVHELVKLGIAHVPEGRGILSNLTVEENLTLGAYFRSDRAGIKSDHERVLELFPRLRERLRQNAGTLSGGEQQMLAIGRALLARPRLLLLDEPSLGLAPQIVQMIFRIIRQINQQGTTILLVEQNAHMALECADQAYVLEVGSVAMHGPAAEISRTDAIRKAYLGG